MALEIGKKAPDFTAQISEDKFISLSDYKDKWVVLYFYPKDNTPGCTKEACSFRDTLSELTSLGAVVLGVSPDSISSHETFKSQQKLNFDLIADPDKTVCNLYDIIGEKNMYGKKIIGVIRTTYIINPDGDIAHVWTNVKVDRHVEKVTEKLKELQSK